MTIIVVMIVVISFYETDHILNTHRKCKHAYKRILYNEESLFAYKVLVKKFANGFVGNIKKNIASLLGSGGGGCDGGK